MTKSDRMADYLCRITITCVEIWVFHQQIIAQLAWRLLSWQYQMM